MAGYTTVRIQMYSHDGTDLDTNVLGQTSFIEFNVKITHPCYFEQDATRAIEYERSWYYIVYGGDKTV